MALATDLAVKVVLPEELIWVGDLEPVPLRVAHGADPEVVVGLLGAGDADDCIVFSSSKSWLRSFWTGGI